MDTKENLIFLSMSKSEEKIQSLIKSVMIAKKKILFFVLNVTYLYVRIAAKSMVMEINICYFLL